MNIVNKLTIRHLKENKRRTLVTIIGVIISVAMVTAVATLGVSFMDLLQRQAIERDGEWHVLYKDVNKAQLKAIEQDEETKAVVLSRERGYALLDGSQNINKPYLFIKEYNAQGFQQFPIELSTGRLPQAAHEVVISEEIISGAKVEYRLGDQIQLAVGQRQLIDGGSQVLQQGQPLVREAGQVKETLINTRAMSYTVVGTIKRPSWEPTWAPGYTIIGYVDEELLSTKDAVDALVVLKKVKGSLFAQAEELARANKIEKVEFNNALLRFYGVVKDDQLRSTLYSFLTTIMAVIVIGSVSLIYNSFAISVSERARHLGMLSSVGATRRQKRNSVFFEGAVIGLISIPIGILCGLGGLSVTFWLINPIFEGALGITQRLTVVVTPLSILAACAISILTIFISTYLPAQRASKISAIDAIRQTTDIKLTGKAVQTSKFIRRLFGIEAEIGLKNLKRNRRRYQATLFSLIISTVLFLAVSFFTASLQKSIELSQDGINFDIQVSSSNVASEREEQLLKAIASLDDVTESSIKREVELTTWLEEEAIAKELREQLGQDSGLVENGKYAYYVNLHALDEASLQRYAREVGVDYQELQDPSRLSCIVIDTINYKDEQAKKYVETKAIHTEIGQSIDLFFTNPETQGETHLHPLAIVALTKQYPMGVMPAGLSGLNIIVSEQVMDRLLEDHKITGVQTQLFLKSTDPMKTQQQIEEMKESQLMIYNVYRSRQQEEQMLLILSVFTYGFISLITAISIANIFNTISTSIALRKREFAMLKSVGMTPKGFNKMLNYESIFYGIKTLLYGLPLSILVMYLIHRSLMNSFSFGFVLPWASMFYVIAAVFVIVTSAMLYSSARVKRENIIDVLKQESI
ncbi:ABC transporter permease [Desulforamulus ferrireducens]|uniref:Cell division protein FtsX n=1 Tax=Desulforamulus ferrireducens TaxID=1833852 RepID=A0A1S6IU22_9FIRM|nr:FtsX-like permease family protein [Desulforamulus ferrireducens]AQS58234.1 cell division protein FtsX [Desulforamulus ferrireducens]